MKKLFEAGLDDIMTGLTPGLNAVEAPLWADARNMHFRVAGAATLRGAARLSFNSEYFDSHAGNFDDASGLFDEASDTAELVSPASMPIRGLLAYRLSDGTARLAFGTRDKFWVYNGGASATEVKSGLSGIADDTSTEVATFHTIESWGDWFLHSNGIDPIQICKNGATSADLTGSPPNFAKIIRKLGPHVVAFNTDLGPNWIEFCAENDVEEWDNANDPTAGNLPVRDLENPINCVQPLGDALGIYSENELQILTYGGTFQFGAKPSITDIGAFGAYGVCAADKLNYGIFFNGVFVTDGFSKQLISERAIGTWLERNVNWDQRGKIVAWHDFGQNTINFSLPLRGSNEPNRIMMIDKTTKAVGFRDQSVSCAAPASVFRYAILGMVGGKLFLDEARDNTIFDGAQINCYLQSKPLDLGEELIWKQIQRFRAKYKNVAGSVNLYVGSSEQPDSTITWNGPYALNLTAPQFSEIWPMVGGLFVHLKFQSQDPNASWTLESFRGDGVLIGRRA